MKKSLFFILLLLIGVYGQSLDSLILKGQKGINRVQHLKSFIPGSGKVFQETARTKSLVMPGPSLYIAQEQRVNDLEASVVKLTVVCDNLQKQSDSHSDNQELFLKLFEILFGGLVSIAVAVIGFKFSKKSGSLPSDGPG
jgi:hypothetical protein